MKNPQQLLLRSKYSADQKLLKLYSDYRLKHCLQMVPNKSIDLNADLGEGGLHDHKIMPFISSCNVACGGHAGDDISMRQSVLLAKLYGVAVGAHPSFPDKEGFGRRDIEICGEDLSNTLKHQMLALKQICKEEAYPVSHVKLHGALYNKAMRETTICKIAGDTCQDVFGAIPFVGLPNSRLRQYADLHKTPYLQEGFADRRYTAEGLLTPRSTDGAVIEDIETRCAQAIALAKNQAITTINGTPLTLAVDTICVHGDCPQAVQTTQKIYSELAAAGFEIKCP